MKLIAVSKSGTKRKGLAGVTRPFCVKRGDTISGSNYCDQLYGAIINPFINYKVAWSSPR